MSAQAACLRGLAEVFRHSDMNLKQHDYKNFLIHNLIKKAVDRLINGTLIGTVHDAKAVQIKPRQ